MAGRPIFKAQIQSLRDGGQELQDRIFESYASGAKSVLELCAELKVGTMVYYAWLKEDEDRWPLWKEMKKIRAQSLAEGSQSVLDNADETKEAVQKAIAQAKNRQWQAGKLDREEFGDQNTPTTSIGQLHLTVVQQLNAEDTKRRIAAAAQKALPAGETIVEPEFEADDVLEDALA